MVELIKEGPAPGEFVTVLARSGGNALVIDEQGRLLRLTVTNEGFDEELLDVQTGGAVNSVAGLTGAISVNDLKAALALDAVSNTSDANKPISTATQNALNAKQDLDSTLTGLAAVDVGIDKLIYATGTDSFAATDFVSHGRQLVAAASAAAVKALLALVQADVGLANVNNTADSAKPVSTAQQAALDLKANLASPALTGNPTAPTQAVGSSNARLATTAFLQNEKGIANGIGSLDAAGKLLIAQLPGMAITTTFTVASEAAMLALVAEQGDIAIRTDTSETYALAAAPASTLTNWKLLLTPGGGGGGVTSVAGLTGVVGSAALKSALTLDLVSNTSDANKPVSTATQAALDAKQALDATLTALAAVTTAADKLVYATGIDTFATADLTAYGRSVIAAVSAAALKTLLALVKADVGLSNVDNTADLSKPVSTAQQTALNLKANLASPALTGVPTAPTAAAATNTTQLATTAFATTADNLKANLASPALTGTPTAPTPVATDSTTKLATMEALHREMQNTPLKNGAVGDNVADDTAALNTSIVDGGTLDGLGKLYRVAGVVSAVSKRQQQKTILHDLRLRANGGQAEVLSFKDSTQNELTSAFIQGDVSNPPAVGFAFRRGDTGRVASENHGINIRTSDEFLKAGFVNYASEVSYFSKLAIDNDRRNDTNSYSAIFQGTAAFWTPPDGWTARASNIEHQVADAVFRRARGMPNTGISITNAAQAVLTVGANSNNFPVDGQIIWIEFATGMTEINGGPYTVSDANIGTQTFKIKDSLGAYIDSTAFGVYTGGAIINYQTGPSLGIQDITQLAFGNLYCVTYGDYAIVVGPGETFAQPDIRQLKMPMFHAEGAPLGFIDIRKNGAVEFWAQGWELFEHNSHIRDAYMRVGTAGAYFEDCKFWIQSEKDGTPRLGFFEGPVSKVRLKNTTIRVPAKMDAQTVPTNTIDDRGHFKQVSHGVKFIREDAILSVLDFKTPPALVRFETDFLADVLPPELKAVGAGTSTVLDDGTTLAIDGVWQLSSAASNGIAGGHELYSRRILRGARGDMALDLIMNPSQAINCAGFFGFTASAGGAANIPFTLDGSNNIIKNPAHPDVATLNACGAYFNPVKSPNWFLVASDAGTLRTAVDVGAVGIPVTSVNQWLRITLSSAKQARLIIDDNPATSVLIADAMSQAVQTRIQCFGFAGVGTAVRTWRIDYLAWEEKRTYGA